LRLVDEVSIDLPNTVQFAVDLALPVVEA
jgi:hypothetical protein